MSKQKDNSTILAKATLRRKALRCCAPDVLILETHGGLGRIYEQCYTKHDGLVIEKNETKAEVLAGQRPSWRVYQGDSIKALEAGIGSDMPFGFIDVDPYGSPFPVLESIFNCSRKLPDTIQLVVNDGLRQKTKLGGAWHMDSLRPIVAKRGNNLYPIYLEVAREMVETIVARAGYEVSAWHGYYCGHAHDMTHYWATLTREGNQ